MSKPHIHIPLDKMHEYLDLALKYSVDMEIFIKGDVMDSTDLEDIRSLKHKLIHNPSISVHGPFMDLSPGAMDPKIRAVTMHRFDRTLDMAALLGAEVVVFHSGYEKWKYALDANLWLDKSLETWAPINRKAQDLGIRIAIENIFEDEPSNLKMLVEAMDSRNFGICFDTGHFNIFSNTPLSLWIDALGLYILELHIHDNDRTFDQHLPIGNGNFDFQVFFSLLRRRDFVITLENHSPADVFKSLDALAKVFESNP